MKTLLTLIIGIFPIVLLAQVLVENPIARQVKGGMNIERVELLNNQTVVHAFCVNDVYKPSAQISTAAPKTNDAFRLIADRVFFKLKDVEGIPFSPESTILNFEDTVFFKMYFDPIPKSTQVIDLIEGASLVESAWMLYGVQMITPTETKEGKSIFTNKEDFKAYYKRNLLTLWDMEGFWKVAFQYKKGKNEDAETLFDYQEVAIVRENNKFQVYNLQGERIDMHFNHLKRERYTYVLPVGYFYPIQVNFNFKKSFTVDFPLARKHQKMLEIESNQRRINCTFDWQFIGR